MKYVQIQEDELLKEIHEFHLPELIKNTVQIFVQNSVEGICSLGTGVLFSFENRYFILTANHNLEGENLRELRLRIEDRLFQFPDIKVYHTKPKRNEKIDRYDVAILELLDSQAISAFEAKMNFIGLNDIQLGANQRMSEKVNITCNDYMCFGFPGRTTRIYEDEKNQFMVSPYLLGCGLNKRNLAPLIKEGFDCHIFINKMKKARKYETKERISIQKLNGLSGGGLWDINYIDAQTGRFVIKLVGILIRQNIDLLIFTKIDLIIGMFRDIVGLRSLPKVMEINRSYG